jgi:hypothetical protein
MLQDAAQLSSGHAGYRLDAPGDVSRLPDGGVHCMGVEETCPDEDHCARTWGEFHAIQMRTPVRLPADVHPRGDWWAAVWQFLYDRELRVDVTPSKRDVV